MTRKTISSDEKQGNEQEPVDSTKLWAQKLQTERNKQSKGKKKGRGGCDCDNVCS